MMTAYFDIVFTNFTFKIKEKGKKSEKYIFIFWQINKFILKFSFFSLVFMLFYFISYLARCLQLPDEADVFDLQHGRWTKVGILIQHVDEGVANNLRDV